MVHVQAQTSPCPLHVLIPLVACTHIHTHTHTHNTHNTHTAHVDYKFPMDDDSEHNARWKKIQQNNLNSKCRSLREKQTE